MLRVFVFILAMVFFLGGIFVNWYWAEIFVAGESQKHPEELLSNETKVLLVLLHEDPDSFQEPLKLSAGLDAMSSGARVLLVVSVVILCPPCL